MTDIATLIRAIREFDGLKPLDSPILHMMIPGAPPSSSAVANFQTSLAAAGTPAATSCCDRPLREAMRSLEASAAGLADRVASRGAAVADDADAASSRAARARLNALPPVAIQAEATVAAPQETASPRHQADSRAAARARMLNAAAEYVASRILVSSALARGKGEIRIRLDKSVLDGSEVRIAVDGRNLSVSLLPATADAAALAERNLQRLETALAACMNSNYRIAVTLEKDKQHETD